jgi:hypothetical protein
MLQTLPAGSHGHQWTSNDAFLFQASSLSAVETRSRPNCDVFFGPVMYTSYRWLPFFFRYQWQCGYKPFPSSGPLCWWFSRTFAGYEKTLVHSQSMCAPSVNQISLGLQFFWMYYGFIINGPNASIQGRQAGQLEGALRNRNLSHVGTFSPLCLVKVPCTQIQRVCHQEYLT